jgi:hypothetical protein
MKNILAAILLATLTTASSAEPVSRQIRLMCGSLEDLQVTMEKYGEKLILASLAPNKKTVNMIYVNFETQTSSWFIHDLETDQYCMSGVGDKLHIPDDSPIESGTGTKTIYK